jgi:hypothetical protein
MFKIVKNVKWAVTGVKRLIVEASHTYTPGYISRGIVTTCIFFILYTGRYLAFAD